MEKLEETKYGLASREVVGRYKEGKLIEEVPPEFFSSRRGESKTPTENPDNESDPANQKE